MILIARRDLIIEEANDAACRALGTDERSLWAAASTICSVRVRLVPAVP